MLLNLSFKLIILILTKGRRKQRLLIQVILLDLNIFRFLKAWFTYPYFLVLVARHIPFLITTFPTYQHSTLSAMMLSEQSIEFLLTVVALFSYLIRFPVHFDSCNFLIIYLTIAIDTSHSLESF